MSQQTSVAQVLKDDEISQLESDNENILSSLHWYLEPGKKRELITRWASNLEELHTKGAYQKPLTSISTHIRDVLKSKGLVHALPYVTEVLDYKYKDDTKIHGEKDEDLRQEILTENSSRHDAELLEIKCLKENANIIRAVEDTIEVYKKFVGHLKKDHLFEPKLSQAELVFTKKIWKFAQIKTTQILDGREKITISDQFYLLSAVGLATLNDIYSKYVLKIRSYESGITPKQVGKIVKGQVRNYLDIYEPKTKEQAIVSGFYGLQCFHCGSFRVVHTWWWKANDNVLFCFACHHYRRKPKTLRIPHDKEIR